MNRNDYYKTYDQDRPAVHVRMPSRDALLALQNHIDLPLSYWIRQAIAIRLQTEGNAELAKLVAVEEVRGEPPVEGVVQMSDNDYQDLPPIASVDVWAGILDCHPQSLRRAITNGDIQSVRLGRLIRIPRHSIVEWLTKGEA